MSNLARFDRDGLELLIDEQTGEVFASMSATARMCGCEVTQIRQLKGVSESLKTLPAKDKRGVVRDTKLLSEELIKKCIAKYNPDLLLKCVDAGLRVFLHSLAGYKYQMVQPEPEHQLPTNYLDALKALVASEEAKTEIEKQLALAETEIAVLEGSLEQAVEVIDELFDYSSIVRVAKYNNCSEARFSWHKLKAASISLNLEVKRVPCPRFGSKNLYSHLAWRNAYPQTKLPDNCLGISIIG